MLYRHGDAGLEVLVAHPGGPYWAKKDEGVWSIPKGEYGPDEEPLAAARREFEEETGSPVPAGELIDLGSVELGTGKVVRAFAVAGDLDLSSFQSNTIEIEWPPRSGRKLEIPEEDRAEWCDPDTARRKLNRFQAELVDRLEAELRARGA
jgi:predicted NUDIX family NTP pyrophosphohydrolase